MEIDQETLDFIKENYRYNPKTGDIWRISKNYSFKVGTKMSNGYLQIGRRHWRMLAHRMAWFLYYGTLPNIDMDHKNRIRTDNRIDNLRLATSAENNRNSTKRNNTKSKYRGVTYHTRDSLWRARIIFNKKEICLGYFKCEEDASRAYEIKAKELFGDFYNDGWK